MKPMTAGEILEWAEQAGPVESLLGKPVKDADWATANHLSYCMRVTALVEVDAVTNPDQEDRVERRLQIASR